MWAGPGIGKATAELLHSRGHRVMATGLGDSTDEAAFDALFNTNVKGNFFTWSSVTNRKPLASSEAAGPWCLLPLHPVHDVAAL